MRAVVTAVLLVAVLGACDPEDEEVTGASGTTADATTTTAASSSGTDTTDTSGAQTSTTTARSSSATTTATGGTSRSTATTTSTGGETTTTTGQPFQSQSSLRIQGRRFEPSDLGVPQRTRVTVTNHDAEVHTWTSDSGEWDSGRIIAGGSFTHSFTRVGTFTYHCEIHPSMTGSVTVT